MSTSLQQFRSVKNSTIEPLPAGGEFLGDWEDLVKPDVSVSAKGDQMCIVHFEFSNDKINIDAFPVGGYTMLADIHLFRTALLTARYFRVRVENVSGVDMTYLRVYPTYGVYRQPNSPLKGGIQDDSDAIITRSVLVAANEAGDYNNVPARTDGSLKVSMANPLTAFGEMLVENNTPIVQATAVYGQLDKMTEFAFGTGASTGVNVFNEFYSDSGNTFPTSATIYTKKACIYRAGQGLSFSFTARFSDPAVGSVQWAGAQNGTDAIVIGYKDDQFGIFFRHWGQHEIQELTLTTGATTNSDATVILNGTPYTVPLTIGTTVQNAVEVADSINAQTGSWRAQQVGSKVIIRSVGVGTYAGAFTFTHSDAVGSFVEISNGEQVTEDFIPSYDFTEGDVLDWMIPQRGNVFRIDVQYLGYGDIEIYAEYPDPKEFRKIHTIHYANEYQRPNITNPSFRLGWTVGNRTGSTPVQCYGASAAGFSQGQRLLIESARSYSYAKSTTTALPILVFKVSETLGNKVNISPAIIQNVSLATDSTKGAIFKLVKNPTLVGDTNYNYVEENVSIGLVDVATSGITGGQVLNTIIVSAGGDRQVDLSNNNLELLPNDVLVITAEVTSGSASQMDVSLTWKEDL